MSDHHVQFVFSIPPDDISQATYDEFYDQHVAEILAVEGYTAARRYWLAPASSKRPDVEFPHLVIYRIDGSPAAADAALGKRYEAGEMSTTEWFGGVQWLTYDGRPLGNDGLEYPDEAYFVLSEAPTLVSEGIDKLQSYELTPGMVTVEDHVAAGVTHGAIYEAQKPSEGEGFSYHGRAASATRSA
ncbi:MAG TPA: hypothetical protein VNT22_01905 [Baekduia sp.]|nr:hypothetical protein [Baekduia sp.]